MKDETQSNREVENTFLQRVAELAPSLGTETLERSTHSVLVHLRRSLSPETEDQLLENIPNEVHALSSTVDLEREHEKLQRTPQPPSQPAKRERPALDWNAFLTQVKEEGNLSDMEEARKVTGAVYAALAELLPAELALRTRFELLPTVARLWIQSILEHDITSRDMGILREQMNEHFQAKDDVQFKRVVNAVTNHLLHRVDQAEAVELLRHIPEEVRLRTGHALQPLPEEHRTEDLSVEELMAEVQRQANLTDEEAAENVVLGVFRGIKTLAPSRVEMVAAVLPEDWQALWEQA